MERLAWNFSKFLLALLLCPFLLQAQGVQHNNIAFTYGANNSVLIIPNATITVCSGTTVPAPGNTCSPTTTIYSNPSLSVTQSNPFSSDTSGNYSFWASAGTSYVVSVSGPSQSTYSYSWTAPSTGSVSTITPANVNNILYVNGTLYATLAAAITACPSQGCIIYDTFPETFSADPIAGTTKAFAVYFGAGLWTLNARITFSSSAQRFIGVGRGTGPNPCTSSTTSTCFLAGASFPSSTAMFRIGNAATTGNVFNTRIEDAEIDCANTSGAIGVYTDAANEKSGTIDTLEINCPVAGIQLNSGSGASSSNSVWRNTEVLPTQSTPAAVGIEIGPNLVTGATFENTTVVCQGTACTNAITIDDAQAITFTHTHMEDATNGIHVGATTASTDLVFFNTTGNSNVTNVFRVETGSTNSIDILGWDKLGATNAILDNLTTCTITDNAGAFYLISASQFRYTNSSQCVSVLPGGLSVTGSIGISSSPIIFNTSYTVATLPSAATVGVNAMVLVSDAMSFTPGTCTGGGTDYVIAISNGSTWSCH